MRSRVSLVCLALFLGVTVGCKGKSDRSESETPGQESAVDGDFVRPPDAISKHMAVSAWGGGEITVITKEVSLGKQGSKPRHGPPYEGPKAHFSPDYRRVAYVEEAEDYSTFHVIIDGVKHKEYGGIKPGIHFSPDDKRVGYVGRSGPKEVMVLDGVEIHENGEQVGGPYFSPDGNAWPIRWFAETRSLSSLTASKGPRMTTSVISFRSSAPMVNVWDIWPVAMTSGTRSSAESKERSFSAKKPGIFNSARIIRRIAYQIERGDNRVIVVDEKEGNAYRCCFTPLFSSNSQRIAYSAERADKHFAVVDGIESKAYDEIYGMDNPFSPDGKRIAYMGTLGGKSMVVVNGSEEKPYEAIILGPQFSPDSKHVLYVAKNGDKSVLVTDGIEKQWFGDVLGSPCFSPDCKHLAYFVKRGEKVVAGLDGVESKEVYDRVGEPLRFPGDAQWAEQFNPFTFSPDSKRLAYPVCRGNKTVLLVDGVAGPSYDDISTVKFTSDGKRMVYVAQRGKKLLLVADGVEGNDYDNLIIHDAFYTTDRPHIFIDSPTSLHTIAVRDNEVFRVEMEIAE